MRVIWGELKFYLILCVVYISFRQRKRGKVYFTESYRLYSPDHSLYWYQKYERKHGFLLIYTLRKTF